MCGFVVAAGPGAGDLSVGRMLETLKHRGPDDCGDYEGAEVVLAHRRLSILDLSPAGRQPMASQNGRFRIVLNGEIYNYLELRAELADYPYRSRTDTEVVLAAYGRWGEGCLDRLTGMFAFAIWDARERRLFAARDRFGVKPLYFHQAHDGTLLLASEIKALLAAGLPARPDPHAWRQYLAYGLYDHSDRTFFEGIQALPPACSLVWEGSPVRVTRWYNLPERVQARFPDTRPEQAVQAEYLERLEQSVRLRFRSDVPVGINVSGGLDSSLLLALVHRVEGPESRASAFTFACDDERYDETPWVRSMLERTLHPWHVCPLRAGDVPARALLVARAEDEPFGGIATLAASRLFETAQDKGVVVLLDGQGMDEQWGGYDYYWGPRGPDRDEPMPVQGSRGPATGRDVLSTDFFRPEAHPADCLPKWTGDPVMDMRLRDILHTKIPRALRFNDRISMMYSCELREPFLDHELVELALRQPADRLARNGERKFLLRQMARQLVPEDVRLAPKRPIQTPQREWLAGALADWLVGVCRQSRYIAEWYAPNAVSIALDRLRRGETDNSFPLWQMVSLALWEAEVCPNSA